jgi:hypothetical protein
MRGWESIVSEEALLKASQREHGRVLVVVDPCHTPRLPVVLDPLTLQQGTGCDKGAASGERAATGKQDAVANCHRRNLPPPNLEQKHCDQVHRPGIRTWVPARGAVALVHDPAGIGEPFHVLPAGFRPAFRLR